jgi:hypothetical protein
LATQQLTDDATVHGAKLQTGRILQALTVRLECGAAGLLPLHLVHHAWQLTCGHAGEEYFCLIIWIDFMVAQSLLLTRRLDMLTCKINKLNLACLLKMDKQV